METLFSSLSNSLDIALSDGEIDLGASHMIPAEKVIRELHSEEFVRATQNEGKTPLSVVEGKQEVKQATLPNPAVEAKKDLFPVPPEDLRVFCDRTALYVARGGAELEQRIRANETNNPTFRFLNKEDEFFPYYQAKLSEATSVAPKPEDMTLEISSDYRVDLSRDVLLVSNGRFNQPLADALETLEKQSGQEEPKLVVDVQQSGQEPKPERPDVQDEVVEVVRDASVTTTPAELVSVPMSAAADGKDKADLFSSASSSSVISQSSDKVAVGASFVVPTATPKPIDESVDSREVSDSVTVSTDAAPILASRDIELTASLMSSAQKSPPPPPPPAAAEDEIPFEVPPSPPMAPVPGLEEEVDEEGWQVVKPELLVDVLASRSGDYEAIKMATEAPRVMIKLHEANGIMAAWCNSETWTNSKMENNEWAHLPILVLDKIFHELMYFPTLKNCALVCKKWNHASKKSPYTMQVFENDRTAKRNAREYQRQQRIAERKKKLKDASRNLLCWGLMLVPFAICAIVGLTGILFFYNLRLQISVFPDCDSAESMMTALYACCAFWLTDACLFLIWSFTAFNQDSWNSPVGSWRRKFTIENVFTICNGFGVLANLGIWTSAAATVNYSLACTPVIPDLTYHVHAFASSCVGLGLVIWVLGVWFEGLVQ